VQLPHALARKVPNAAREWGWQRVFPQHHRWRDAQSRQEGHHRLDATLVQKAVRRAVLAAGIAKPAGGYSDVRTTMIDTNVLNRGPLGVASPSDLL
jgi:hypothetical protein